MAFVAGNMHPGAGPAATIGGDPRPAGLDDPQPVAAASAAPNAADHKTAAEQAQAAIYKEAEQRGYAAGIERGRVAGLAQAEAEIEGRIADARSLLEAATRALTEPWNAMRGDIADAIVAAAVHLAQAMVGQMPGVDPDLMRRIVVEILEEAAGVGGGGHAVRFRVSPGNQAQVTRWTAESGAEVMADDRLGAADVRAEWVGKDGDPMNRIDWDATLEGRWRAVRRALGLAQQEP